jgi:3-hydroxy-D-aspartate aldolase
MSHHHPAQVGITLQDVETPALIVDLDAVERNLKRLADALEGTGVVHRAHAKMHKCPILAQKQMEHGAVGVCCQKVSEAKAMVEGGVDNVLITNEIVDPRKIERLATLATRATISVCVDDPLNVPMLSDATQKFGITLLVLVEINVGANRGGIEPGKEALKLAQAVDAAPGLRFAGLQAYQGSAQHKRTSAERKQAIDHAVELTRHSNNTGADGKPFTEFEHALFIYATVMSTAVPGQALIDVGHKAQSSDSGPPVVFGTPGVEFIKASDEHGVLKLSDDAPKLTIGDKIKLIPGHIDPTCNLHEVYVVMRGDRVEALWPITARGPGL